MMDVVTFQTRLMPSIIQSPEWQTSLGPQGNFGVNSETFLERCVDG